MAVKYITELIDDLDGTPINTGGHSIEFVWIDGKRRHLDLNDDNYNTLIEVMAPYVDNAQILTSKGKPVKRTRIATGTKEIRAWARQHGYEVSDRGRIPEEIMEAYKAA